MRKLEDKEAWCVRTAARLRAVHASFGDRSADDRRLYLEDELGYALDEAEGLAGQSRDGLLRSLEACFPVYGEGYGAVAHGPEDRQATAASAPALDVGELIAALETQREALGEEQRQRLAGLLGGSRTPEQAPAVTRELAARLSFPSEPHEMEDCLRGIDTVCRGLGWAEGTQPPLRLSRLVKMLGIMIDLFGGLYPFAWQFWRGVAPRDLGGQLGQSFTRTVEEVVAEYLEGGEVSSREFYQEVERTKKVIVGMLYSAHQAGLEYGKYCERKFSPDSIIDAVALEETASDPSKIRDLGRKCWDKYSALARNRTAEAMHEEFLRILAETVHLYVKKQA